METLTGYIVETFDDLYDLLNRYNVLFPTSNIYHYGNSSDYMATFNEGLASQYVKPIRLSTGVFYLNYIKMRALQNRNELNVYHNVDVTQPMCKTARESIQTLLSKKYFIIYKPNN